MICAMITSNQKNTLSQKQMLQEIASRMSSSAREEIRNFIDELGLSLVSVSPSNTAAL